MENETSSEVREELTELTAGADTEVRLSGEILEGTAITDGIWRGLYYSPAVCEEATEKYLDVRIDVEHDRIERGRCIASQYDDGVVLDMRLSDPEVVKRVEDKELRYLSSDINLSVDQIRGTVLGISKVLWVSLCRSPACDLCTMRGVKMAEGTEELTIQELQNQLVQLKANSDVDHEKLAELEATLNETLTDEPEDGETTETPEGESEDSNEQLQDDIVVGITDLSWDEVAFIAAGPSGPTIVMKGSEDEYEGLSPAEILSTAADQEAELQTTITETWDTLGFVAIGPGGLSATYTTEEEEMTSEEVTELEGKLKTLGSENEQLASEKDQLASELADTNQKLTDIQTEFDEMKAQLAQHDADRKAELASSIVDIRVALGDVAKDGIDDAKKELEHVELAALTQIHQTLSSVKVKKETKTPRVGEDSSEQLSAEQSERVRLFGHKEPGGE